MKNVTNRVKHVILFYLMAAILATLILYKNICFKINVLKIAHPIIMRMMEKLAVILHVYPAMQPVMNVMAPIIINVHNVYGPNYSIKILA